MPKAKKTKKATKTPAPRKAPAGAKAGAARKAPTGAPAPAAARAAEFRSVPHAALFPSPLNPRRALPDEASRAALADSIAAQGVLEPLLARPGAPDRPGTFEIIAGERRWRAVGALIRAKRLPADHALPVMVRPASDAELVELAAAENMARADMHPLDEAAAIKAMRRYHADDGEIMRRLGVPERTFYRRAALLRLAPSVAEALRDGKLSLVQATAFASGTAGAQAQYLKKPGWSPEGWSGRPETIRAAMLEGRIPVVAAAFPLKSYDGELFTDAETGKRYFEDQAAFERLQKAAIKAKVEALKAQKLAFVKQIEAWESSAYSSAPKGAKGAGAVWWCDQAGAFHARSPVLSRAASHRGGVDGDAAAAVATSDARADKELQRQQMEAQCKQLFAAIEENPAVFRVLSLFDLLRQDMPVNDGIMGAIAERLATATELLRGALELDAETAPEDVWNEIGALSPQGDQLAAVFRVLRTLDADVLDRAVRTIHLAQMVDGCFAYAGTLLPLGLEILQRELGLTAQSGAEPVDIAGAPEAAP